MTYAEALAFWYGRIDYELRAARPGDLNLERMQALLHRLGDPHDRLRLVHVTGTKGKGSTSAMLASILRCAGYRVGLFTSPHLTDIAERIQIDGVPISRDDLASCMEEVAGAAHALPGLTFFEIGTALGFLHFRRCRVDVAAIEVGLGGRFDSTNVCTPLVSIITNVGFDHMAQLGNTLEAIAFEKAGIIKRGVPVVSGVVREGPRRVARAVAAELAAPFWESRETRLDPAVRIGLLGTHQRENAACAVAAIHRLREAGFAISDEAIAAGLAAVRWPARIEVVATSPTIILDTAHNVPSAEALVKTLRETFPTVAEKAVVFAVSSDKQVPEIVAILAAYFDRFHLTRYGNNPRSVPVATLAATLQAVAPGKAATTHPTSGEAWAAARVAAGPNDLVCVTGSVFLAGELRPTLRAT